MEAGRKQVQVELVTVFHAHCSRSPCSQAYLDSFEDLLLTAQGLGMPAPIPPPATSMRRLTSLEVSTSQQLGT